MYYPLTDHLPFQGAARGSTGMTTDASGYEIAEIRYKAWGESRYTWNTLPTKYTYTGQYSNVSDFGLMYYNARWYDSALSRWTQPDSIIPDAAYPHSWDRYSYTKNNPVNHIDPSGHREIECDENGTCLDFHKLKTEYHQADNWQDAGLSFDEYVIGYVSYHYFIGHPTEALQNCMNDTDEYFYADTYSEYVLHELFQPFDEGPVMVMVEQAKSSNNVKDFYGSLLWLSTGLFFGSDKGFGGGTASWKFGSFKSSKNGPIKCQKEDGQLSRLTTRF